jgi:hypothetical protein
LYVFKSHVYERSVGEEIEELGRRQTFTVLSFPQLTTPLPSALHATR